MRTNALARPGRGALVAMAMAAAWWLSLAPALLGPGDAFAKQTNPSFTLNAVCFDFKGSTEIGGHPDFDVPDLAGAGLGGLYTAGLASPVFDEDGNPKCMAAYAPTTDWDDHVTTTADHVYGLDFPVSSLTGFAAAGTVGASTGSIVKTVNQGQSWTVVHTMARTLTDIDMVDNGTGWAVGLGGTVLRTTDGGFSWTPQFTDGTSIHYSIWALDAGTAWIAANLGVIFKTTDGGNTWNAIGNAVTGTTSHLRAVRFVDAQHGMAVGNNGTIIRTSDGGATWTPSIPGTAAHLRAIHAHDANTAWVAGNVGTMIKTTDAGGTWSSQATACTVNLNGLTFSDDGLAGFAVGDSGAMIQTTDGGATWAATPRISGAANLNDVVYLPAEGRGFAAAHGGIIKRRVRSGTLISADWVHSAGPAEAREMFDAAAGDTRGLYNGLHNGFITAPETMAEWYQSVPGRNMSAVIEFKFVKLVDDPSYRFSTIDFAPIDNLLFGNTPGEPHNFDFTVKCVWTFTYKEDRGQWFSYRGNDDCWIYVDGRPALDMGGTHAPTMQFIDFDRCGLSDGQEYEMRIFMAKRRHTANLVQMATNVVFRADNTPSISQLAD